MDSSVIILCCYSRQHLRRGIVPPVLPFAAHCTPNSFSPWYAARQSSTYLFRCTPPQLTTLFCLVLSGDFFESFGKKWVRKAIDNLRPRTFEPSVSFVEPLFLSIRQTFAAAYCTPLPIVSAWIKGLHCPPIANNNSAPAAQVWVIEALGPRTGPLRPPFPNNILLAPVRS